MSYSLIVVESPAKAKTISKYLGKDYKVAASVGHIKDLPKNNLGVNIEGGFQPEYEVIRGKGKVIKDIRKTAEKADVVYLAPDPDREGEAIAWHIREEIKKKAKNIKRILFHEVTKKAIQESLKHPLELDENKFNSQQARRILDRLVGYQISPLLWKKVRRGLSAGRVQSVAVKIVVDREKEIRAFQSEEYWTIAVLEQPQDSGLSAFEAKLLKTDGKKSEIPNEETATIIVEELKNNPHLLSNIEKKERRKYAPPPFITSKLQQDAARRLHFPPKKTMMVAQRLYEGVPLGDLGETGLITYMRTDSTRTSEDALTAVREYIGKTYGPDTLPAKPNSFKNKKNSQDAHEAIRPTSMDLAPEKVKKYLSREQFRLYELIWNRFVASQMKPAVYDGTKFDITCARHLLRATGSILKFAGYLAVYQESTDGDDKSDEGKLLPALNEGETLIAQEVNPKQNFTQPPPRFTEASLVKELEEKGIGRPSTYATILSTIQDKEYVEKKENKLHPSELGEIVNQLLEESFPGIMDITFTAGMEEQLDDVEDGSVGWLELLNGFYSPFQKSLEEAKENMRNLKREETPTGLFCEKCEKEGRPKAELIIKWGKNGRFVGCSAYPECTFTSEYKTKESGEIELVKEETTSETCEKCGSPMVIKNGRFGKFLACSNYPACKNTKPVKIGIKCPEPGCQGDLVEKRTKRGKLFYGCDQYPSCKFASWNKPVNQNCPACGHHFMVEKNSRDGRVTLECPECKHRVAKPEAVTEEKRESVV